VAVAAPEVPPSPVPAPPVPAAGLTPGLTAPGLVGVPLPAAPGVTLVPGLVPPVPPEPDPPEEPVPEEPVPPVPDPPDPPPPAVVTGVVAGGDVVVVEAGGDVVVVVEAGGDVVVVVEAGGDVVVVEAGGDVVVVVAGAAVVVVVGGVRSHPGWVKVSPPNVTSPFRANACPSTLTPSVMVIELKAMIVPVKLVVVAVAPSDAELPTCQKTLQACASFSKRTLLDPSTVRPLPTWNMNTAVGSFSALSVTVPLYWSALEALYTPAVNVWLLMSGPTVAVAGSPAVVVYAVVRSDCAWAAAASTTCSMPGGPTMPGGKPVTEVMGVPFPGLTPRSPGMVVAPVLVTDCPPNTE
jgi:hypothetical protein